MKWESTECGGKGGEYSQSVTLLSSYIHVIPWEISISMALISVYAIASLALNLYPELHILISNWLLSISTGIQAALSPAPACSHIFPVLIMALLLAQTNPLGVSLSFTCLYTLPSSSVNLPSKHIWVWIILSNFGPSQNIVPPGAFRCYKNPPWSVSPTSSFAVFLSTHFALVSLALSGLKFPSLDVPQGLLFGIPSAWMLSLQLQTCLKLLLQSALASNVSSLESPVLIILSKTDLSTSSLIMHHFLSWSTFLLVFITT